MSSWTSPTKTEGITRMIWTRLINIRRRKRKNSSEDNEDGTNGRAGTNSSEIIPLTINSSKRGDGRSIHIDSPLVRRMKQLDRYTKFSYLWFIVSIYMLYHGFTNCITNQSFTKLQCSIENDGCTLEDKGPSSSTTRHPNFMTTTLFIPNHHLVKTEFVCVSKKDRTIIQRYGSSSPSTNHSPIYGCFKQGGVYSYTLVFDMNINDYEYYITHPLEHPFYFHPIEDDATESKNSDTGNTIDDDNTATPYTSKNFIEATYVMRKYNLSKEQNREQYYRLGSYLHGLLHDVEIKHEQFFTKSGLTKMLLGMISITFWMLFGQLRDPSLSKSPSLPGDHTKRVRQLQERQRRRLNQ